MSEMVGRDGVCSVLADAAILDCWILSEHLSWSPFVILGWPCAVHKGSLDST